MVLPSKSLAAFQARKGSFVGVGSYVNEKVVTLGETSLAELANELLFNPVNNE